MLELVHSDGQPTANQERAPDTFSPSLTTSHGTLGLMKTKSEVFEKFKVWKARVENQTGLKVGSLRSDNGGEYTSLQFKKFCAEHGIGRQYVVPNTPQKNGVSERINRTLQEKARCMRLQAKLPTCYWGDALRYACYLINRSPHKRTHGDLPESGWGGKSPSATWYVLRSSQSKIGYMNLNIASKVLLIR